jgi:serpin B
MRLLTTVLTLTLIPAAALAQRYPAPGTSLPTLVAGNEQFSRKLLFEAHKADPTHNIVLTPLPLTLFLTAVQIESWDSVTTDELAGPFGWASIYPSSLYGGSPMLLAAFRRPSPQDLAEIRKRLAAGDHPSVESTWLESTLLYPASHTPESLLNRRFLHTARQVFAIHLQSTPTSPRTLPSDAIHLTLQSHMHVQMVWAGNTFSMSRPFLSTFQPESGPSTPAEMQTSELSQYPYARTDDFEAAVLPCYNGTMTVILPLAGKTISQIEQSLAANPKLLDSMAPHIGLITIPSVHLTQSHDLKPALEALGIHQIFKSLDKLTTVPAKVTDVQQSLSLNFNRNGIWGDSDTTVGMVMGGIMAASEPFQLTLNRHFLFLIREQNTAALTYIGAIMNPTQP